MSHVRRYRPANEVAVVCGMSWIRLHDGFAKPGGWAMPRDFMVTRQGVYLYAEDRLPALAGILHAAGEHSAALLLEEWAVKIVKERVTAEAEAPQEDRIVSVQRELVERSDEDLNRQLLQRRHPSDTESARYEWENE